MQNSEKIKFHNLSWVIVLIFDTVEDAEFFAKQENLDIRKKGKDTVVVVMEE